VFPEWLPSCLVGDRPWLFSLVASIWGYDMASHVIGNEENGGSISVPSGGAGQEFDCWLSKIVRAEDKGIYLRPSECIAPTGGHTVVRRGCAGMRAVDASISVDHLGAQVVGSSITGMQVSRHIGYSAGPVDFSTLSGVEWSTKAGLSGLRLVDGAMSGLGSAQDAGAFLRGSDVLTEPDEQWSIRPEYSATLAVDASSNRLTLAQDVGASLQAANYLPVTGLEPLIGAGGYGAQLADASFNTIAQFDVPAGCVGTLDGLVDTDALSSIAPDHCSVQGLEGSFHMVGLSRYVEAGAPSIDYSAGAHVISSMGVDNALVEMVDNSRIGIVRTGQEGTLLQLSECEPLVDIGSVPSPSIGEYLQPVAGAGHDLVQPRIAACTPRLADISGAAAYPAIGQYLQPVLDAAHDAAQISIAQYMPRLGDIAGTLAPPSIADYVQAVTGGTDGTSLYQPWSVLPALSQTLPLNLDRLATSETPARRIEPEHSGVVVDQLVERIEEAVETRVRRQVQPLQQSLQNMMKEDRWLIYVNLLDLLWSGVMNIYTSCITGGRMTPLAWKSASVFVVLAVLLTLLGRKRR